MGLRYTLCSPVLVGDKYLLSQILMPGDTAFSIPWREIRARYIGNLGKFQKPEFYFPRIVWKAPSFFIRVRFRYAGIPRAYCLFITLNN